MSLNFRFVPVHQPNDLIFLKSLIVIMEILMSTNNLKSPNQSNFLDQTIQICCCLHGGGFQSNQVNLHYKTNKQTKKKKEKKKILD